MCFSTLTLMSSHSRAPAATWMLGGDETVIARAHMNLATYGGVAMRGNLIDGFNSVILTTGF